MIKLKGIPNGNAILQVYMPIKQTSEDKIKEIYEKLKNSLNSQILGKNELSWEIGERNCG